MKKDVIKISIKFRKEVLFEGNFYLNKLSALYESDYKKFKLMEEEERTSEETELLNEKELSNIIDKLKKQGNTGENINKILRTKGIANLA